MRCSVVATLMVYLLLTSVAAADTQAQAAPPTLGQLLVSMERFDALQLEVRAVLDHTRPSDEALDLLQQQDQRLRGALARLPDEDLSAAGNAQLIDLQTEVSNDSHALNIGAEKLSNALQEQEAILARLRAEQDAWLGRIETARGLMAPEAFMRRLHNKQALTAKLIGQLLPARDHLLGLLERAASLRAQIEGLSDELVKRRSQLVQQSRLAEGDPLWVLLAPLQLDWRAIALERKAHWTAIAAYLQLHWLALTLLAIPLMCLSYAIMRRLHASLDKNFTDGIDLRATRRVIMQAPVASLLLTLLAVFALGPAAPTAFYNLLWLILPLLSAWLCQAALRLGHCYTLWALAVAMLALPFRPLLELLPPLDRLVLLGQLLLVAVALGLDWRAIGKGSLHFHLPQRLLLLLGALLLLGLASGIYLAVLGYIGLARSLRNGLLGSFGFAMVYFCLYHIMLGIGVVLLRSRVGQHSRLVRDRRQAMEQLWRALLRVLLVLGLLSAPLVAFGLDDRLPPLASALMASTLSVGQVSIGVGPLVAALLCLLVTYVLVRVQGALLDHEVLPRLHVREGAAYAISVLCRYAMAVVGAVLALGIAGIDLTKMAFLAGAVGVGIGFGLQNIVNNFISGLILLVEQPVHVGDVVETSAASGVIKYIGIRASTITTVQGADVIVPNGELLSRDLINWTRSNRRRRVDLLVGVAYASDPQRVRRLLLEVLDGHPKVMSKPAPSVLLMDFADNALSFRVSAWVPEVADAFDIASELRLAILDCFVEAGIEIPYPQRDLWIRSLPTAADAVGEGAKAARRESDG